MSEENDVISQLVAKALKEMKILSKNSMGVEQKLEEKVTKAIGLVLEDFIDNSLQAGALYSLYNNSNVIDKKTILHYFNTNYVIGSNTCFEL
ncbi:hypothetical protein RS030_6910 [Cryptosporidium xiaoi]|uniref:Uncharacterized protein n=1 Tax=Cryptosporidium xiaoi TaxID=659607 RepID=A0AAV9XU80_9CRYT